jgi:deferrochelatase/peroxidase EfeB
MAAWKALSTEEQEKAIGRRKFNDMELSDEEKPENAHNAVTNIEDEDGNELKIVRANMPFANPAKGEFGTYFIRLRGQIFHHAQNAGKYVYRRARGQHGPPSRLQHGRNGHTVLCSLDGYTGSVGRRLGIYKPACGMLGVCIGERHNDDFS